MQVHEKSTIKVIPYPNLMHHQKEAVVAAKMKKTTKKKKKMGKNIHPNQNGNKIKTTTTGTIKQQILEG